MATHDEYNATPSTGFGYCSAVVGAAIKLAKAGLCQHNRIPAER
jgi:hypothetical protein